jgi:hypothetical protein
MKAVSIMRMFQFNYTIRNKFTVNENQLQKKLLLFKQKFRTSSRETKKSLRFTTHSLQIVSFMRYKSFILLLISSFILINLLTNIFFKTSPFSLFIPSFLFFTYILFFHIASLTDS